jgi:antitoxin YefM
MNFTQHIDADNLTSDFLDYVKKMFKGRKIKLTIETEMDDTAYLMASEANHKRLIKSMKNVKNREKLVRLNKQELKKLIA